MKYKNSCFYELQFVHFLCIMRYGITCQNLSGPSIVGGLLTHSILGLLPVVLLGAFLAILGG